MRMAVLVAAPLSVLAFIIMFSVGTSCGIGYRERGGLGGCVSEVGRQWGVLANASPSPGDSFRDVSASNGASAAEPAVLRAGGASTRTASWRQVTYWTGRGNKDTEAFMVSRPAWRINWTTKSGTGAGAESLRVTLYDPTDQSTSIVADTTGSADGTEEMIRGPGVYRLKIEAANVDWYVQIEES